MTFSEFKILYRHRWTHLVNGWQMAKLRPFWLDALLYAAVRAWRLNSASFHQHCDEIDRIIKEQFRWGRQYTVDSGRECFLDGYIAGLTPHEAVDAEASYWAE